MDLEAIEHNIGKQLKMLRIAQKTSQKDLAEKMGITYQQVQKYENGLNRISVSRLWQFCKIFDVSPNYLFESILSEPIDDKSTANLIPNTVATSQDIKMMLAFKNIENSDKRVLIIKLCEAFNS